MSKRPDQVVYNEEEQQYDAALKPYATNVGAPAIVTDDTISWKRNHVDAVNKQVKAKYDELKKAYDQLMEEFEYNNLVYQARFNFQPIVGETYHLYKDAKEESFLSLIAPQECSFDYVGSFRLSADKLWEKL